MHILMKMNSVVKKWSHHHDTPTRYDLIQTLKTKGMKKLPIIGAFKRVERDLFVPPEQASNAYFDKSIPLFSGQQSLTPFLMARMMDALKLKGTERVLVIGTAMGFHAALLACLAKEVYSIEPNQEQVDVATANLRAAGIHNTFVFSGEGAQGLPFGAPFHAILASSPVPTIPFSWIEQLKPLGRIVAPIGTKGDESIMVYQKLRTQKREVLFEPLLSSRKVAA